MPSTRASGTQVLTILTALFCLAGCTPGPDARRAEIYELKADPTERNLERIRERLQDADRDVRATALYALVSAPVPDSEALAVSAMEDPDGFVRSTAAKLLGDLRAAAAVPLLARHLLQDPDPIVRQRCAETLAIIGGPEAEQGLFEALGDPLERVRLAAVDGATLLNPAGCFDQLALLTLEDPEWEIRARAARGLGRSGVNEAEQVLERALEDSNEFVRSAATNALRTLEALKE